VSRGPGNGAGVLSIVTTSMGRLHHVQRSLPLLAALADVQCVLVDYACPDGTGDWVERHFPQVQVVRAAGTRQFSLGRARNLGAGAVTSDWLAFVDADVLMDAAFVRDLLPQLKGRQYFVATPCPHELSGLVICRREDFHAIGGYDELFENWGSEDRDFYTRLQRSGCTRTGIDPKAIAFIAHGDHERTVHHAIKDRFVSLRINGMYYQIKTDLARQADVVELDLADRQAIYARIRQLVLTNPHAPARMEIKLPPTGDFTAPPGWRLRRSMQFHFEPL